MDERLNTKIRVATKWSSITEILAKIISPLTNMILARLLSPEMFGVVATVTMVTSFAEMFADAGFQKYLVQHEFEDDKELEEHTTVAFWSNFVVSIFLWIVIFIFRNSLATIVGSPGLGIALSVASLSLPLTSFSSIQMALFRRKLDFKTLFYVRIIGVSVPFFVTVPLAFLTHSYWALIIGTLGLNISNAIVLTICSKWKPRFYYSIQQFKKMISFSMWSLLEQITIWLNGYVGTFIVGAYLSSYYLGIYKTSITTVNQIMSVITSATTPVVFASLSRMQNNKVEYKRTFFNFQRWVGYLVIPLGLGIFLYDDLVTDILLGSQWTEATNFVGLWGLMSTITIVLSHYSSEVYRSLGKPRLSFWAQVLHLIVLIPVIIFSAQQGFETLYIWRSLVRLEGIGVNLIIMYIIIRISPLEMFNNIKLSIFATIVMSGVALGLQQVSDSIVWSIFSVLVCIVVYFCTLLLFPASRTELLVFKDQIIATIKKENNYIEI